MSASVAWCEMFGDPHMPRVRPKFRLVRNFYSSTFRFPRIRRSIEKLEAPRQTRVAEHFAAPLLIRSSVEGER